MKTSLLYLLACAAAPALAGDTPSLTGKWQIHTSISGNESDQVCTFAQKDSDLTGSCVSDRGTVAISGKIDGAKMTWTYKSEYNGSPLTVAYAGVLDSATKITGTVNVPEYGAQGDFTGAPAK